MPRRGEGSRARRPTPRPKRPMQDEQKPKKAAAAPVIRQKRPMQDERRDPTIVARQQALRRAGYDIPLDGVWGQRSQQAWEQLQGRERRGAAVDAKSLAEERVQVERARELARRTTAEARRAVAEIKSSRGLRAAGVVESIRQTKQSGELRTTIARDRARDQRDGQILELPTGREAAQDSIRQRREMEALRMQRVGEIVNDRPALAASLTIDELAAAINNPDSGGFDGTNPQTVKLLQLWLKARGYNLTPDGRFGVSTARALERAIREHRRTERRKQIGVVVDRYYDDPRMRPGAPGPEGFPLARVPRPGELLELLQGNGANAFIAPLLLRYLEGNQLSRFTQGNVQYRAWRQRYLERRRHLVYGPFSNLKVFGPANRLFFDVPAQDLVISARSFDDLEQKLTELEQRQDREREKQQIGRMRDAPWWARALERISLAEETLTYMQAIDESLNVGDIRGFLSTEAAIVARMFGNTTAAERIEHGPAAIALERGRLEQVRFAEAHPYRNFVGEVLLDPTNAIPGKVWVSPFIITAKVTLRAERLGLALSKGGVPLLGETLRLPAASGRALVDLRNTAAARKYLLRSRKVALRAADARVRTAIQLGFKPAKAKGSRAETAGAVVGEDELIDFKPTTVLRWELEASETQYGDALQESFVKLHDTFVRHRVSFYAREGSNELTTVGGDLAARVMRGKRTELIEQRAAEFAHEKLVAHVERSGFAMGSREFADSYERQWEKFLAAERERFAPYLGGSDDPEVARRVYAAIERELDEFSRELYDEIIPAWQARLIQAYEREGLSIFSPETGVWMGVGGPLERTLTTVAKSLFNDPDVTVKNPIHGSVVNAETFRELHDAEYRRRAARITERANRLAAEGTPYAEGTVDRLLDEIEYDLARAWRTVRGGYTDVRATIDVPAMYAPKAGAAVDVEEVFAHALPYNTTTDDVQAIKPLLGLLMRPGEEARDLSVKELNDELDQLIRWTGPQSDILVNGDQSYERFQAARLRRKAALGDAYDEAIGKALRDEGMYWEALRYAETLPLRLTWYGLQGATSAWKFAVLPLRMGWTVRNVVDNTVKSFLEGNRDPRYWIRGSRVPGKATHDLVESVFESGLRDLRAAAKVMDGMFGTDAIRWLDRAEESFWQLESRAQKAVFDAHGVPVPESFLDDMKTVAYAGSGPPRLTYAPHLSRARVGTRTVGFVRDLLYDLMGARPENFFKRSLYRATYAKTLQRTGDELLAFRVAVSKVEKTLFDYSKVTVLEDNLRVIWPFVQFWRKNATFWAQQVVERPWFLLTLARTEQWWQEDINGDLPEWMRRYLHFDQLGDAIAQVPGLGWLGNYLRSQDVMTDPLSYLSITPLWRAFKSENPALPEDRAGWRFIAPFVDALNSWGLSFNPLLRKPLEVGGVLNYRAWQHIFPQTDLIQAFTGAYWSERFGSRGLDVEAMLLDPLFERMGATPPSELNERAFNEYVQVEMAGQRLRGERLSRKAAQEKIRDYLLVRALFGYFIGVYVRKMTPQDKQLYEIVDALHFETDAYQQLTEDEKRAYDLFRRRKLDVMDFDRYITVSPLIQSYYAQPSYADAEQFKQQHPEVIQYVEPVWRQPSLAFVRGQMVAGRTPYAFEFFNLTDTLKIDRATARAAEPLWVTPELRALWRANNTPLDERRAHISASYHQHIAHLNATFHAIPESDFKARESFVNEHPELKRWWDDNNSIADDLNTILNDAKADLRDRYFEIVQERGFDVAARWFRDFNFIFEGTSAEGRITPDGQWVGKHTGARSAHAKAYLIAKPHLQFFFSLSPKERAAWLAGRSEGARIVRDYFARYAHGGGMTQRAQAYLTAKPYLDYYFALPKEKRRGWLDGNGRAQQVVRDYFKRFGTWHTFERRFSGGGDWAKIADSRNPQIRRRLEFWQQFFQLSPDQRPAFVMQHAEAAGIFVYGPLGAKERHDREQRWMRESVARGMTEKAAAYLRIKPLMDLYFKLTSKEDKRLLLKANPELTEYFELYADGPASGNAKVDKLVEQYFRLPRGSNARTEFLKRHPEVQHYFDAKSSPAERAMHRLLDVYFQLDPRDRKTFRLEHPEIVAFFDRKKAERDREKEIGIAFEMADPRLREAREYALWQVKDAELRRWQLAMESARRDYADEIQLTRR